METIYPSRCVGRERPFSQLFELGQANNRKQKKRLNSPHQKVTPHAGLFLAPSWYYPWTFLLLVILWSELQL
jgi:hypothetical protein